MGKFGGYYKGEKKKTKRDKLEEKLGGKIHHIVSTPQVEIIGRGKGKGK
jgi:hypothetical protein